MSGKTIAPMYPSYIRAIFDAFDEPIEDAAILEIIQASRQIRVQHQRTGVIAAEAMVEMFLKDVETYGLDDALVGFDDRHESGNVTLLKVSAVGEQMDVSLERADIL